MTRNTHQTIRIAAHIGPALLGAWFILSTRIDTWILWWLGGGIGGVIVALDALRAYYAWPKFERIKRACLSADPMCASDHRWLYNFKMRWEPLIRGWVREEELHRLSASGWYISGMLSAFGLSCAADMRWVSGYALLYLGVVDVAARVVGVEWPIKRPLRWDGKSVGGLMGGLCAALLSAAIVHMTLSFSPYPRHFTQLRVYAVIVPGAISAGYAEALSNHRDNFAIPVFSALVMLLVESIPIA